MSILQDDNRRNSDPLSVLHEPALTIRAAPAAWITALVLACNTGSGNETSNQTVAYQEKASYPQGPSRIGEKIQCRISRISDGDTVYCGSAGRIRLLLIDAPELSQGSSGREARETLAALMPVGTAVTVETDVRLRDQYNRVLGYVYLPDGRMVNEEMARSGYVTALVYPPNVRYVERIRRAVEEARKARRGLWATDLFECSPRDYRAGRCRGTHPGDVRR